MAKLLEIEQFLHTYLRVDEYKVEKHVNGINIKGREEVTKIAVGMAPNLELFAKAAEWGADLIITHHTLLEESSMKKGIQGVLRERIAFLIRSDISLMCYHLPLDFHEEVGNNIVILKKLGASFVHRFGEYGEFQNIFFVGRFPSSLPRVEVIKNIAQVFDQEPKTALFGREYISTIAVVSGGGGDKEFVSQISPREIDLYLTGEIREVIPPMVEEMGLNFVAAGHYATEVFGVQEIAEKLREQFDVEVKFIEVRVPY